MESVIIKLPQFEGPIELLFALVQRSELDICSLGLSALIKQLAVIVDSQLNHLDTGAESIGHAGSLLWIKSRALLPKNNEELLAVENPAELQSALLQKLVEYCRFKDAASHLSLREEKAKEAFYRPIAQGEAKKTLGLEHVSLAELAAVFQCVLEKAKDTRGFIEEEEWRVSDKMVEILQRLKAENKISFESIFQSDYIKLELIVLFLAILELMKLAEIRVIKIDATLMITAYG